MGPRDADRGTRDPGPAAGVPLVDAREFETHTGEPIQRVLDLDTWLPGENLAALYARLEQVVAAAVRREDRILDAIRREVFPVLASPGRTGAPRDAGVYRARVEDIERVHRGLLFNGAVEACDGTSVLHDTLPVTIAQIGVCLVSYQGDQGSLVQRLFRRDLCVGGQDAVQEALDVLERRQQRAGLEQESRRDTLSDMGRRSIMAYAERAALLYRSKARWRMGHGSPTPWELLIGTGMVEMLERSVDLLRTLVLDHRRFVFVPSAPSARWLLTIGNALGPLEYAVVDTLEEWMSRVIDASGYRGEWGERVLAGVRAFAAETGPRVVRGLYRASAMAPAQLFYAHADHVHEAALIALADSVLQEHRGFPMLIDLADRLCAATFDPASFNTSARLAYLDAGEPFRYLSERGTRR